MNSFQSSIIFTKSAIIDVRLDSKYSCGHSVYFSLILLKVYCLSCHIENLKIITVGLAFE